MNKMTPDLPARRPAICVFCGSSQGSDPAYAEAAARFGTLLVQNDFDLVFGGGGVGLMGEVAASVARSNGKILGIIPNFLKHLEPPLHVASQIVVTETMNDRKAQMFAACDGFAVLPGGLGTLDEFFEALTYAQLHLHEKPIVIVNVKNYFAPLIALIDHMVTHGFAHASAKDLMHVVATPEDAIKVFAARVAAPVR